jgi:hypothetical protein
MPTVEIPEIDSGHWRLNMIKHRQGQRVAMINGRVVKVGDYLDGARVRSIDDGQVVLQLKSARIVKLLLPSVQLRKGD